MNPLAISVTTHAEAIPGGLFTATDDGRVVGTLAYDDYGESGALLLHDHAGTSSCLRALVDAAANVARFRGIKLRTSEPELSAVLASDALRDVREPSETELVQSTEREIPVPALLRELLTQLELSRPYRDDEHRYKAVTTGAVRGSVQLLSSGQIPISYSPTEGVLSTARLSKEEALRIADGSATTIHVGEALYRPSPLALVCQAERMFDSFVADGGIELIGDEDPVARHGTIFTLAERVRPRWAAWRDEPAPTQFPSHARALRAWLSVQPEIRGVEIDERTLLLRMIPLLWPRAL